MIGSVKHTIEYFRAPAKYFWRWADAGEVIVWHDGSTICYRDELVLLLRDFYCYKPPSLSALLLLLAACNKNFEQCGGKGILAGIFQTVESYNNQPPTDAEKEELQLHLNKALQFMDVVASLPEELKKGRERMSLMQQVFSAGDFSMTFVPLKDAADELDSGRVDQFVFRKIFPVTTASFKDDVAYLSNALDKYPNAEILSFRLRTGLSALPAPAELPLIEQTSVDFLTELLQDPQTAGVAKLAQHIVAAINIPMHVQGSSNMPLGGISDITNRGNFDRLLLSELAYEDELLMARLVNNEALFLRREEPPEHPKLQRTILLDTTIKMWGLPRVFAVSAALAVAQNRKHHELVEGYALGGESYGSIDLYSKEGVMQTLAKLDAALHCGTALEKSMKEIVSADGNEFFLLTDASTFESRSFYPFFSSVKEKISYVITVSRDGELKFYSWANGINKLVSTARLDLEELLFTDMPVKKEIKKSEPLPVFYHQKIAPLYFPQLRISSDSHKLYYFGKAGLLVVNETNRLLCIWDKNKGAIELLEFIEKGSYCFGRDDRNDNLFFVLVNNVQKKLLKFYAVDSVGNKINEVDLSEQFPISRDLIFKNNIFFFRTDELSYGLNALSGKVSEITDKVVIKDIFKNAGIQAASKQHGLLNTVLNNNYSVLFNVKEIFINTVGELVIGRQTLKKMPNGHIVFDENKERKNKNTKEAKDISGVYYPLSNKKIKCNKWRWDNGSEIFFDGKGFMHLISSDESIPEITIVLILDRSTACWASDGNVCGSEYFTGVAGTSRIPVDQFYKKYILAFIDRLI